jgi:hypothetical protein
MNHIFPCLKMQYGNKGGNPIEVEAWIHKKHWNAKKGQRAYPFLLYCVASLGFLVNFVTFATFFTIPL